MVHGNDVLKRQQFSLYALNVSTDEHLIKTNIRDRARQYAPVETTIFYKCNKFMLYVAFSEQHNIFHLSGQ